MVTNANKGQRGNREAGNKDVKANPDAAQGLRDLMEEQLQGKCLLSSINLKLNI